MSTYDNAGRVHRRAFIVGHAVFILCVTVALIQEGFCPSSFHPLHHQHVCAVLYSNIYAETSLHR